jgi:hypothetical protein
MTTMWRWDFLHSTILSITDNANSKGRCTVLIAHQRLIQRVDGRVVTGAVAHWSASLQVPLFPLILRSEEFHHYGRPAARQRPAFIDQRLIIVDPRPGLAQLLQRCLGGDDVGNHDLVDRPDHRQDICACKRTDLAPPLVRQPPLLH